MYIIRSLGQDFEHGLVHDLLQTVLSVASCVKPGCSDYIITKDYAASVLVSQGW